MIDCNKTQGNIRKYKNIQGYIRKQKETTRNTNYLQKNNENQAREIGISCPDEKEQFPIKCVKGII